MNAYDYLGMDTFLLAVLPTESNPWGSEDFGAPTGDDRAAASVAAANNQNWMSYAEGAAAGALSLVIANQNAAVAAVIASVNQGTAAAMDVVAASNQATAVTQALGYNNAAAAALSSIGSAAIDASLALAVSTASTSLVASATSSIAVTRHLTSTGSVEVGAYQGISTEGTRYSAAEIAATGHLSDVMATARQASAGPSAWQAIVNDFQANASALNTRAAIGEAVAWTGVPGGSNLETGESVVVVGRVAGTVTRAAIKAITPSYKQRVIINAGLDIVNDWAGVVQNKVPDYYTMTAPEAQPAIVHVVEAKPVAGMKP